MIAPCRTARDRGGSPRSGARPRRRRASSPPMIAAVFGPERDAAEQVAAVEEDQVTIVEARARVLFLDRSEKAVPSAVRNQVKTTSSARQAITPNGWTAPTARPIAQSREQQVGQRPQGPDRPDHLGPEDLPARERRRDQADPGVLLALGGQPAGRRRGDPQRPEHEDRGADGPEEHVEVAPGRADREVARRSTSRRWPA